MKKRIMFSGVLRLLPLVSVLAAGCAGTGGGGAMPLEAVPSVDLDRYLGRWYEIARFQHSFEKNLVGVTAEYAKRPDGKVSVLNSGFRGTLDGPYREAKATARVPDPSNPGRLTVRFFIFDAPYIIFALDPDYGWALVGDDSRKFLWILARTHEIDDTLYRELVETAKGKGFDTSKLVKIPQKPR